MPEFSNEDRLVIMAEQSLWIVVDILNAEVRNDHGFTKDIEALLKSAHEVAVQLRDYNDQFETSPDWIE